MFETNVGVESTNLSWSTILKPRREGMGGPTKEVEWDAEDPTDKAHKKFESPNQEGGGAKSGMTAKSPTGLRFVTNSAQKSIMK